MTEERVTYSNGVLDEIVIEDCMIHLEQMSDAFYWAAVYKDGRQVAVLHIYGTVTVMEEAVEK